MMLPRDYQQFAIEETIRYICEEEGNPVVAMPTGTGKSVVIAGMIWWMLSRWPLTRVMVLTHSKLLIEQNAEKLTNMWPSAPVGVYSAGLNKKQNGYPVTFAGIQSVAKIAPMFGHVDILLIDEAHAISPNETTSYQTFINGLLEVNPNMKVVGLTATPYRLGLGMITDNGIFTDIAVDMCSLEAFNWFIDEGYLSPLIPRPTNTKLDVSGVKKRGGEFVEKDLQRAVDKAEITDAALREAMELAHDRQRILVFGTGVEHVEHIRDALLALGESAVCVHSKQGATENAAAFEAHRNGTARWMVGNNIFTTGYDDEKVDCIVMLRPTQSPGLWVQMLGRGTRPYYVNGYLGSMIGHNGGPPLGALYDLETREGRLASLAASPKNNCLVLDFAANTLTLGPVNDPQIPKPKGKGTGEPPVKFCEKQKVKQGSPDWDKLTETQRDEFLSRYEKTPDGVYQVTGCSAFNHTTARNCCQCGAEFIFVPKIQTVASEQELIAKTRKDEKKAPVPENAPPEVHEFPVDRVVYSVHQKAGGEQSMKVVYHCGLRSFSEWVLAWHSSPIKAKGRAWWKERTKYFDVPDTVEEAVALSDELNVPTAIRVWVNKKYPEIVGHVF